MKSFLLFCIAICFGIYSTAQTIVPTTPENKNALIEEFTGIACGFCPYGHKEVAQFIAAHPEDGFSIAYHQGFFAIPDPGQPDYTTEDGDGLGSYFSVNAWPNGLINRHDWGEGMLYPLNDWSQYASQVLTESAYVNVACESTVDVQTRELTVHVETYYTGDSPSASNFLNVALTQNNIKGPQFSSWFNPDAITPDGAYMHQHMLRDLITGQWGEEISPTTTGTFIDKTFTYTVPETINDIPVHLGDLGIISFIVETETEVNNVQGTHPELINFAYALDAGIDVLELPETSCSGIESKVTVGNYGSEAITSITFQIEVTGDEPETYIWEGEAIAPFTSKEIEIPTVYYSAMGTADYTISIISVNGATDENASNNMTQASFGEAVEVALPVSLHLQTDQYFGTAWYLYDDQENLILSGSGYDYNSIYDITLDVDAGCYKFEMTDLDGFFFGSYSLKDGNNNTFFSRLGNFGNSEVTAFTLPIYEPTAIIGASTKAACIGGTIQFYDKSTGGASEWEWTFDGGNPASSTEKNPRVNYNNPSEYDVSLKVTNALGTDYIMMEDFISVTSLAFGNLALQFDGINDYVQAINESAFDLTTALTLELWIKPESLSGTQGLLSKHFGNNAHPYQVRLNGDEIIFGFYSNTIGWQPVETYNANLPLNQWSHIACTYDMAQAKIYVNGIQKASANKSFEIPTNDQAFEIGRSKDVAFEYFDGTIDEVRVWDIARSSGEIIENTCTNYSGMTIPGLVANYKFNECGGTLLTDSQNGNDAILIGMEGDEWLESDACPVYNVDFTVTADPGAMPIEGATISLNGTIRYTDDSGQANFEGYETGMYEYVVSADGFEMAGGDFELINENVSIEVILILSDIEDITSDKVHTWPNPVNGVLNIQTPLAYDLEIMDMYGRVILLSTLEPGTSHIDLSGELPGVYYLKLSRDGQFRIEKIMVW
jgi:PKD repeat protein